DARARDLAGGPGLRLAGRSADHERRAELAGHGERHLRPRGIDLEAGKLRPAWWVRLTRGPKPDAGRERTGDRPDVQVTFKAHRVFPPCLRAIGRCGGLQPAIG